VNVAISEPTTIRPTGRLGLEGESAGIEVAPKIREQVRDVGIVGKVEIKSIRFS
jgi:hypothetical protein